MECHKPKCSYISPSGAGCLAYAVKGQPYCFYHDPRPEAVAKREKSLMKGAKRQRSYEGLASWEPRHIDSMEDLKIALDELFNAGISGELSTSRISALASVANTLGKVIDGSDLEKRIKAIEDRQAALGMRP